MSLAASEIRRVFLDFFAQRNHRTVSSSSLVPEADPTLLFTNAGMVQFKDTFLGEIQRDYVRATTSQKCMRVSGKHNDLENVGRTPRHHTFFEMLGNFSFGDYFKQEAIEFAWELVTEGLEISPDRLVVTVFREDDAAFDLWREGIGLPSEKLYRLDEAENFWSMGDTGPCGPCSEIHIDFGVNPDCPGPCDPSCDCGRWLEIWNLVFMQFDRSATGEMTPLPKPSIDTGAGLERLAAVIQGVPTNYDTDLFRGILDRAQEIAGVERGRDADHDVSLNVVADHARAVTFLIGDGVLPSSDGRGYVLRRILRRAARHGVLLGIEEPFLYQVADAVIDEMAPAYPELEDRRAFIRDRVEREEARFLETLSKGLALVDGEIEKLVSRGDGTLAGDVVFKLYDTFGFPVDLTQDILRGRGLELDQSGFDSAMSEQRQRARAAWKGSGDERTSEVYTQLTSDLSSEFAGYDSLDQESTLRAILVDGEVRSEAHAGDVVEVVTDRTSFYGESGGQVGDRGTLATSTGRVEVTDTRKPTERLIVHHGRVVEGDLFVDTPVELAVDSTLRAATVRNHSGTHLLHAALRQVLGNQVMQKGSLVAPDRLRFDFTHDSPLSDAEIEAVEDLVNEAIEANESAEVREMPYTDAIAAGAIAIFDEKYGDHVRVVSMGSTSTELCGGTHARTTGEIGLLKVISESGIAAGVRRIEALTGLGALAHLRDEQRILRRAADALRAAPSEVAERVEKLLEERRRLEREVEELKTASRGGATADLSAGAAEIAGVKVVAARLEDVDGKALRGMVDDLRANLGSGVVLLVSVSGERVALALGVTPDLIGRFRAGDMVKEIAALVGGKGGGRPDFAQAGGNDPSKVDVALQRFQDLISGG
ncbi:alanine--tRNA ligase [Myxococcota bacterium]|nr:alanine--tRNA ligase [Myxococcota bacterium]